MSELVPERTPTADPVALLRAATGEAMAAEAELELERQEQEQERARGES